MTISSSLNAGVAGLQANATRLASISDNIANSNTFGYKRVQTDFHSMVTGSAGGSYSAGGVRASTQRFIDQNGTLVSTSNSTDLAVRGRGFLPVVQEAEVQSGTGEITMNLTTTGSFRANEEGYLATDNGLYLLGWPADSEGNVIQGARDTSAGLEPVRINLNEFSGQPTTTMDVAVNLPASATEAGASGDSETLSIEYFDNLGVSRSIIATFTPTVPGVGSSNEWTMVLTDSAQAGATIGEYVMTFDDSRAAGGTLASVTTTSGGAYDPTTGSVIVNVAGGPIEIGIGEIGDPNGMSQLSYSFAPTTLSKDGSPIGNVAAMEVDANGYVIARFDTGISRTIFQVPLVDLPNPNGMAAMDNQTYLPTANSGGFFLWDAGSGPTGEVEGFAREESTVDVAGELTSMIQTQRAYSSNAKVIQTVDEMLQETTNIKR